MSSNPPPRCKVGGGNDAQSRGALALAFIAGGIVSGFGWRHDLAGGVIVIERCALCGLADQLEKGRVDVRGGLIDNPSLRGGG